ncbi:hypothetical protein [Mycolicibacterium komossense]|uniref:Uncharacterized protein n=1 Tax=Mycolicibacterium komossense TaxID=1779 RepID=A0ABT3CL40_9MYCO|nr:hypothetical protein [Mycolicibacterium komossense]MCV7230233.1 hypothetical protein [Mycolicibacterium komossense]
MRFVLTALLWIVTTVLLAVAVPAAWAQQNVVDVDGYARLAQNAAADPAVQDAMAAELTSQLVNLASNSGYDTRTELLSAAATGYTRSAAFPGQFATVNRIAHRWMFTDVVQQSDSSGRWVVDLSPMLADSSFQQTLQDYGITAPSSLEVPLTDRASESLRPGQLRQVGRWGPWVSVAATILTGVFALLTLAAARSRGKALAALGVSALMVGAAGWAGLEIGRRYVSNALNNTSGDVRRLADALVGHAIGSLHQYLNLTLAAGGGLVALGVLAAVLGSLRRKSV